MPLLFMEDQVRVLSRKNCADLYFDVKLMFLGFWGLIAAGLFKDEGLLLSGSIDMLVWNAIGGGVIIGYYLITAAILFFGLKQLGLFRIKTKLEITGLDQPYHNEPAYIFNSRKGKYD